MPAWFFAPDIHPGAIELSPEESHHASRVRRVAPGEAVVLFDGAGTLAYGRLLEASDAVPGGRKRAHVVVRVAVEGIERQPADTRELHLLVPGCKGERLSFLVEKATELGARSLLFTQFERSVVPVEERQLDRLRRITLEACKQCARAALPQLSAEQPLAARLAAVRSMRPSAAVVYGTPDSSAPPESLWREKSLYAVVGPEGGLTAHEEATLQQAGARPVRIGRHTLRVETAALAIASAWAAHA